MGEIHFNKEILAPIWLGFTVLLFIRFFITPKDSWFIAAFSSFVAFIFIIKYEELKVKKPTGKE